MLKRGGDMVKMESVTIKVPAEMKKYIVESTLGARTWLADNMNHAIEQHINAFLDEPIEAVYPVKNLPSVPEILDSIRFYVSSTEWHGITGSVVLTDGSKWSLGNTVDVTGYVDHISLWNGKHSIAFESVDELRGWMRCHRSMHS